jgi:sugar lactone lactonase YvrE
MSGLTKRIAQDNASKMVCLLLAGTLAACKHNAMSTMDTKGLWIANGMNVIEYIPNQLTGGTSAAVPHLMINSAAFGSPQGVTFDKAGNLWVMDPGGKVNGTATPALFEFSAAQLAALKTNSAPDPVTTITSTALAFPQQSVFDANGNQWVSDHDNNTVVVFTAAQLAMQGVNPTIPVVGITSASFNGPLGIVFDAAGNLWVANNGGVMGANGVASPTGTTVVEFAAAHLPTPPATGMVTPDLMPDVILSDDGKGSIQGPWALAFDTTGNLWSNNASSPFTVVEFMKTSLAMTAAPMPAVTLSPTMVGGNPTLDGPNGLCFDDAGDLATTDAENAFGIAFYGKGQLMTGAPVPSTFIIGAATTLNAPAGCNFGPAVN